MRGRFSLRAVLLVAAFWGASAAAVADEVRLVASNAVKELVQALIPEFEKDTGHRVSASFGGTPDIRQLAATGGNFDLVVIPLEVVEDLERQGKLLSGGHRDFVASSIGAAVAPGSTRYGVSDWAALRASLLAARSVVLSSGPSSLHLLSLIERMGVRDAVAPKILRLAPGESVGEALAQGRGELGFTQTSELLRVPGIEQLGPLGPQVQRTTVFAFGVHPGAGKPCPAVGALVDFLTAPAQAAHVREAGLDPR